MQNLKVGPTEVAEIILKIIINNVCIRKLLQGVEFNHTAMYTYQN